MNDIPVMTDPLGRYWEQPSRDAILTDAVYAVMTMATWKSLCNYETSIPTGAYPGKMWRRQRDAETPTLCWYDVHPTKPDMCLVHTREVLRLEEASLVPEERR